MSLLNANINSKAYYAIRKLVIEPKTNRYLYSWLAARYLNNWDALGWSFKQKQQANSVELWEWTGLQWRKVPG